MSRFLLAKLHIESLSKKSTIKRVREALKTLPKDLNDSYDTAMKRIEDQNEEERSIAHSTLTWVVNAKRLLTVAELQVALAVEPGAKELDDDNLLDIEIILAACAGLVIMDEQLSVVRLVHYTTQEYFDRIQEQQFPDAQIEITRTLLTFLSFDGFLDASLTYSLLPLVNYSQYCLVHAVGPPEHRIRNMILEFIGLASHWKTAMWQWDCPPWEFREWPSQVSTLWFAVAANLLETARLLLKDTPTLQPTDSPEIIVASYYGNIQMVQLLVQHGADVNALGGDYGSALQAASYDGHIDIVQLLIEHGADVNAQGGHFGSALQAASHNGHMNTIQLLIEHGADVNAQGGHFGSALQAASHNGHMNTIQLLIEHGADVNVQVGFYGSALQAVSHNRHPDIVQFLIEHGADVNAQGGEYGTALQVASYKGHIDIVQLLIGHGADVHVQGGKYGSALKAALYRGPDRNQHLIFSHNHDTLNERLEATAQLLRDNGAQEEDKHSLCNAVSEHDGQQAVDGEYSFLMARAGTDVNCRII
jgi:ankyrin repeat protein